MDSVTVRHLAQLARLALPTDQIASIETELTQVLGMVQALQQVKVDAVEPMGNPLDATLGLREDAVTEPDRHAMLAALAPEFQGGFYLVPKVIE